MTTQDTSTITNPDTAKTDHPYALLAGDDPIGLYSNEHVASHALDLLTNCTPGLLPSYTASLTVNPSATALESKPVHPDEQGYNGWTNRETWALALHLDNTEGSYTYWREVATERLDDAKEVTEQFNEGWSESDIRTEATHALADILEEDVDSWQDMVEMAATHVYHSISRDQWLMFTDVGSHTSSINYREIAGHWVDEVAGNED